MYLGGEGFFIRCLSGQVESEELMAVVGHHRQALHAYSATLEHPRSGAPLEVRAPLAPDMVALAKAHQLSLTPNPEDV